MAVNFNESDCSTSTKGVANYGSDQPFLNAADSVEKPIEIESLCMNCRENGITKLMSTRIPFYKQVILMSFYCEKCGYRNNEIQSGEPVQEFGTEIVLNVKVKLDLNRTVVKSEFASIEIPEVELTVPSGSQPGEVTNVEGVLNRVSTGLEQDQEERRKLHPEDAEKIDKFLERLRDLKELNLLWTLKLRDPTGNCFIQNLDPLHVDPRCITSHYYRPLAENKLLGLADDQEEENEAGVSAEDREWKSYEECKQEVMRFPGSCQRCAMPAETLMKPTDIPYFQTVIIMSTNCEHCGFKSNDVKSGGATKDFGCRLALTIEEEVDLARDVLKSDTCNLRLPHVDVEMGAFALSGRFTTVEGMLGAVRDQLAEQGQFYFGDSSTSEEREKLQTILAEIDAVKRMERKSTKFVLDDPAGNSYIMSLTAPLDDPRLQKEYYTRTYDQNEELGLNDMKVDNYQEMEVINEEKEDIEGEDNSGMPEKKKRKEF